MYTRLWWKDVRQFWPIWVFLALFAALVQGLVVHYSDPETLRDGILGGLAWSWTALYAVAVGAAAFAAERETGTLRFLDVLPASRRVVWVGKVSFALVSTLALAGILFVMAALGSEQWRTVWGARGLENALPVAGLLLQVLALGLFCSSIMGNALLAALAAIGLTTLSCFGLLTSLDQFYGRFYGMRAYLSWQIVGVLTPTIASFIAFTWSRRTRRVPLRFRFQSPLAMSWSGPPRASRAAAPVLPPDAPEALTPTSVPVPISFAVGTVTARPWSADQPRPRSWFTESRYLAWQTWREGWKTWFYLLAFGLIFPMALYLITMPIAPVRDMTFALPWNGLVALAAGVSVFGLENQRRTYRFLVHHGARPGTVWQTKLGMWCLGLAIIWVPIIVITAIDSTVVPLERREGLLRFAYYLSLAFAVSQLCGMVIPRGITAGVIALVVTLTLGAAEESLIQARMMPEWALLALPVAFLVVTWAWSGDWFLDRPALGRYLRLGLLLAGTFGVLLGGHAGFRAWEIPDPGSIAPPSTWTATPLPADRNAAELYREAARKLAKIPSKNAEMDDPGRLEAIDLIRQAAARPDCRFQQSDRLNAFNGPDLSPVRELAGLVMYQARNRTHRGDLAGAWDDIVVLLRMARHVSEGATMFQDLQAIAIELETLDLARNWSTAPGQTPDRLRAAIAAYRDLPRLTPTAEVVRGEGILLERTFDLPTDDLKGPLLELMVGPKTLANGNVPIWASLYIDMITTPWERTRARRANRQIASFLAREASLEPWQQQLGPKQPIALDVQSAPLMKYLGANTGTCIEAEAQSEAARRGLVQVMAIRAWQLRHDGQFPGRLDDLVPDELPSLPTDPYSGKPFGYVTYAQALRDPELSTQPVSAFWAVQFPGTKMLPETRLLYSVGPDGRDHHAIPAQAFGFGGNLVFPIPPLASQKPAKPADRSPSAPGGEPAKAKEPTKPAPDKPTAPPGSRP